MLLFSSVPQLRAQLAASEAGSLECQVLRQGMQEAQEQLEEAEARSEALEGQVSELRSRVASMTPIINNARLDNQARGGGG